MIGLVIVEVAIATAAGIGVYLSERVDRPRRRAMREAQMQPAEEAELVIGVVPIP